MNRNTIDPKALVLYTKDGTDLNLETAFSLEDLCDKNIPLIDYYIIQKNFRVSSAQTKITVSINTYEGNYNATDYTNSLYIAYYLFMTRNKLTVDNEEPRPRFLLSGLNMDDFSNDYLNYLTKNDIIKEHLILFFKDIDPQLIDLKVRSRLAKGITGCRLFNIFKMNEGNKVTNLDNRTKQVYNTVREVAKLGPYLEMHPELQPENLRSISLNKNLQNLILRVYDDSQLEEFIKKKLLSQRLSYDDNNEEYKEWTLSTFAGFNIKLKEYFKLD